MELVIALEHRFHRTPDGKVWTPTSLSQRSWARYLTTFDRVRLLARVEEVPRAAPAWLRVDSDRVGVLPVPYYVGPRAYAVRALAVAAAVREALAAHPRAAVILRVPGTIGFLAARALRAVGRPFGLEVVGDPWDVFAPGASDHPVRAVARWYATAQLRRVCRQSAASLYVTAGALQRRYPAAPGAATFAASDVELDPAAFAAAPRAEGTPPSPPFRLVHVGTLAALYKAPDLLLRAVARCARGGLDVELAILGDGQHRAELEALAAELALGRRAAFLGHQPSGVAVRRELDRAHLFVLPSRQEGLPRAMVEAMARGLPCLGTRVGGIPELLDADGLVDGDEVALSQRILALAREPGRLAAMSARNLAAAQAFREEALQPVRERFHRCVAAAARGDAAAA